MAKRKSVKARRPKRPERERTASAARGPVLREIQLENFKPFATKQTIPLAPITVIYGPNSSGKSSIIQSLLLLKQSIEGHGVSSSGLIVRGEYADLGSYKSLIHKHEISRDLLISLTYTPGSSTGGRRPGFRHGIGEGPWRTELAFAATTSPGSRKEDSSKLERVAYEATGEQALSLRFSATERQRRRSPSPFYRRDAAHMRLFAWADDESIRSYAEHSFRAQQEMLQLQQRQRQRQRQPRKGKGKGKGTDPDAEISIEQIIQWLHGTIVGAIGFLPEVVVPDRPVAELDDLSAVIRRGWFPGSLDAFAWGYQDVIRSISYLGPLRSYPERHYLISGGARQTVGSRGEFTPQIIYRRQEVLTKQLNEWFLRFEVPYRLGIKKFSDEVTGDIISIHLLDKRTGVKVAASDVGFGIGQLLPIIVEGMVATNRILCVEQPEIHLHPRLQAHVADLLIDAAGLARPNDGEGEPTGNQWLIETHSEALILRLQRRIREGRIAANDVSVLYVEPCGEAGSTVRRLMLDDRGEFLDEWPGGFFEEGYREVFGAVEE